MWRQAPGRYTGPNGRIRMVSVQDVKAMLKSNEVFAFFDLREEGEFSIKGHPLFATPLPLSRLEPRVFALLPDPRTRVVLMDAGDEGETGRANRGAARLKQMGYGNVAVMKGGLKAWADADRKSTRLNSSHANK